MCWRSSISSSEAITAAAVYRRPDDHELWLIDNWLPHIRDLWYKYSSLLGELHPEDRTNIISEIHVIEQVYNQPGTLNHYALCLETWQNVAIHDWVYALHDSLLSNLEITATSREALEQRYRHGMVTLLQRYGS